MHLFSVCLFVFVFVFVCLFVTTLRSEHTTTATVIAGGGDTPLQSVQSVESGGYVSSVQSIEEFR